jgi:hypothetical protein
MPDQQFCNSNWADKRKAERPFAWKGNYSTDLRQMSMQQFLNHLRVKYGKHRCSTQETG